MVRKLVLRLKRNCVVLMLTTSSQQIKDVAWLEEQKTLIAVYQSKQNLDTACMENAACIELNI